MSRSNFLSTSIFNVGRSMFNVLSGLWILVSGFSAAQTQPLTQEELNAQLHLQAKPNFQRLPTGEKIFNWIGQSGFTYFIQASPDLLDWTWAPNIESGIDGPMSYEVDGPNAAGFFRLVRTDQTAVDLDAADFDGDGFSNNFELTPRPRPGGIVGYANLNPNIQTNPLRADTDGDGLSDKWELENGFDPTDSGTRLADNGADGDPDNDGVTNLNEQRLGTRPKGNATTTDSDADGTLDFEDAVPGDNLVSWKRTTDSSYALIEIVTPSATSSAQDLNDIGEVLFGNAIWAGGEWIPRQAGPLSGADPYGSTYDASVGWTHFNTDRKLIGSAHIIFNDGGNAAGGDGVGSIAFWVNGQSTPSLLLDTADLWENVPNHFTPIGVAADGSMVHLISPQPGTTAYLGRYDPSGALIAQMEGSDGYNPSADWGHAAVTGTGWVASNLSRPASSGQSHPHRVGLWDASNYPVTLPAEANGWGYPVSAKDLPNGKVVLTAGAYNGSTTTGRVFLPNPTGQFEYATKLSNKNIELFAGDGSALTSDYNLWRNGELTPMADLCPRYKELLEAGNTISPLRSNKNGTYLIQVQTPTDPPTTTAAILVPVDLVTDLNNDGKIDADDRKLRDAAMASGANEEVRDKGTEFVFHNDKLSNGIWDVEDNDPARPVTEKNDDDAEEIYINPGITDGEIWLEHPAIERIGFYKTAECKDNEKVYLSASNRYTASSTHVLPKKLFMRVEGDLAYPNDNPQIEGDLLLKVKIGPNGQEVVISKIKLTSVKAVGAKKYFHAARDYIGEKNTKLCVKIESLGEPSDPSRYRILSMLHEKTEMKAVDSFHRATKLFGIDAVAAGYPTYDVLINGNFCYSTNGRFGSKIPEVNEMTNKCHGRLITEGVEQPSSSTGGSQVYESAIADFIGWNSKSGIQIQTGIVPVAPIVHTEALGGFGSNLLEEGSKHPWYGLANTGSTKIFFTVTPFGITERNTKSARLELRGKIKDSGCPALPGGQPGEIQCLYGDGESSLGLSYKIADSTFMTKLKGAKHFQHNNTIPQQGDYFINTYLLFKSKKPR